MKSQSKIFIITFSMLILAAQSFAANEKDLSYKLQKGDKYNLDITNRQTINMNMMGQSMNLIQNININQEVVVAEKDDKNNYTLELAYKRIQFQQNAMGMEVNWDSDHPDTTDFMSKQIGASLGKAIEKTITAVIDSRGNPISINKSEVIEQASSISGFESGMMVVYADKSVKEGETWQVTMKPDPNSDFVIVSEYKLDEIRGKTANISFIGTITGTQIMGETADINGTITGKTQINVATGWIISASINQNMEMEMEQQGVKVPMQMSSFIEITSSNN